MSRIIVDKDICSGKTVIEGTRVPVALVLGKLAAGMTYKKVCQEYAITRDDILAVLKYAQKLVEAYEEAGWKMKKNKMVVRREPMELTDEDREWIESGLEEWGRLLDEMDSEDEIAPNSKEKEAKKSPEP